MEDGLEYLKKRDGIAAADLDAHREQRAAAALSQYTSSLAPATSIRVANSQTVFKSALPFV
jgi:hypothetical protein